MTSPFRKAMVWLGLGPDEEYDDLDFYDEGPAPRQERPAPPADARDRNEEEAPARPARQPAARQPAGRPPASRPRPRAREEEPEPRRSRPQPAQQSSVRTLPSVAPSGGGRAPEEQRTATVRPMRPTSAKAFVVEPRSFEDAQELGDRFKAGQPVAADLQDTERDLARRLIDFASGLCYGLGGRMERVGGQVYLLTPSNVDVSAEERRRLAERAER